MLFKNDRSTFNRQVRGYYVEVDHTDDFDYASA